MKNPRNHPLPQNYRPGPLGRLMACLSLLSLSAASLSAQTLTWSGASATDANWSDTANWGGSTVASADALTFAGTTRQINTNNVSGLVGLGQITLSSAGWNISGASVAIAAGFTDSGSSGANTWGLATTISNQTPVSVTSDTLSFTNVFSGPGSIVKYGAGTLTLAGANTYSGSTTVSNGVCNVTGNEVGANGSWLMPVNYATASINFKAGSVIVVASTNIIQIGSAPSAGTPNYQTLNSSGAVTNNGTLLLGRGGYVNVVGGSWVQAGTMIDSAPSGSGYGAQMVISNGVNFIYTGASPIQVSPAFNTGGDGILDIYGATFTTDQGFTNAVLVTTTTGYGQIVLTNGGTISLSANVPQLLSFVNTNNTPPLSLGTGGGAINTAGFSTTVSNTIAGAGSFTKLGAGTLTLSASNTYTGKTFVSAGTLALSGAGSIPAASSITVASGATYDVSALATYNLTQALYTTNGSGSVNGSVNATTTANIFPSGSSGAVGTLTFSNNLTLNSSVVTLELSPSASSGNDLINVLGTFTVNGTVELVLDPTVGTSGALAAGTYTLATYGSLSGSGTVVLASAITNATLNVGANAITLTVGAGGSTVQTTSFFATTTTPTWTGGSAVDSYWSDPTNWGGYLVSTSSTVTLTFSGTSRITNTNNLAGVTLGAVLLTNSVWNIQGNAVTLTSGSFADNVSGSSVWGLNSTLNTTPSFTQNGTGDGLTLSGYLSGSGGITKTAGANGQGTLTLSGTTNSFTGGINIYSGTVIIDSLALGGQPSSLGAGTSTINVGYTGTSYGGTLTYAGTNYGITDRNLNFANLTTGAAAFNNNSPNGSSLEFDGAVNFSEGTAADSFSVAFGGSSTGTNIFEGELSGTSLAGAALAISGPGTWVFENLIGFTNNITISTNTHVVFSYTNVFGSSQMPGVGKITMAPGGTLDLSTYDQNYTTFTLGSYSGGLGTFPQTLIAGRTNGTATDVNGSLSLAGPAGATLNVAGTGVAGTLSISTNLVLGSGTVNMDLSTNTTIGSSVNDLILVGGNLDLSQGTATISVNAFKGQIVTNTPYTIISYTGTLIGGASGLTVPSPGRLFSPGVVSTSVPGLVQVTFGPSGLTNANLVWSGSLGTTWDVNTTANWLSGGSSSVFDNYDNVTFNDTSAQPAVSVAAVVSPGNLTISNSINNYVFTATSGGYISGTTAVTKQGTAEATLDTPNTYNGGTTISAGTLSAGNGTAFGSGGITLGDGNTGTNNVSLLVNGGVAITNAITVTASVTNTAIIGYETGANCTVDSPISIQRNLTIYSTNPSTSYSLLFGAGGISGTGNLTFTGGGSFKLQNATGGALTNLVGNIYITPGTNGGGSYVGFNAAVSTGCNVFVGSNCILGNVSSPAFNALTGSGFIEPGYGAGYDATMYVGSGNGSGTFSGSFTTNSGGFYCYLQKNGTGTEILTGDNSLASGGTTVSAGILAVNNTNGYGLGLGGVSVSAAGTLEGNGIIYANGANTFSISGKLTVGNTGDTTGATFTLTNTSGLTINSGGSLNVSLFSGAGAGNNTGNAAAADVLVAACPVTLSSNSVLNVANPESLTAWALGDQWKIANWKSTVSGTFTTLNLPTLPSGLAWSTASLYSSGILSVVAGGPTQPANITGTSLSGNNFVLYGTNLNGGSSFHYEVLMTTNVTLALTNWTVLSTNSFNADGSFSFTNVINPAQPAAFFSVEAVP